VDNGAWKAFQQHQPFDETAFASLVERYGSSADFVVIPDVVAGGMGSLEFSLGWIPKLKHLKKLLLPVQDGMDVFSVAAVLHEYRNVGIFLGGSTEWKLKTMYTWGVVAATVNRHYHVGRVNSMRRIRMAAEAGADSFDGTSATMYACTLPMLEAARQQPSLFAPKRDSSIEVPKVERDEIYDGAINALRSGATIDSLREEIEAANRHVEGMKQRPIFSGIYPDKEV
jgi:hypothetical protein